MEDIQQSFRVKTSEEKNYKSLDLKILLDFSQTYIVDFFGKITRQEYYLRQLIRDRADLRAALEEKNMFESSQQPYFIQKLVAQNMLKGKKKKCDEYLVDLGAYFYINVGPAIYELLQRNAGFPSRSTVLRRLGAEEPIVEGQLQTKQVSENLERLKLSKYIWISVDETKIQPAITYDSRSDSIMGLKLPVDVNQMPVPDFYKFKNVTETIENLEKYPKSSYASLMLATTLDRNSQSFTLMLTGTDLKETGEMQFTRWNYVAKKSHEDGMIVRGECDNINVK